MKWAIVLYTFALLWAGSCSASVGPRSIHHELYLRIHPDVHKLAVLDIIEIETDGFRDASLKLNPDSKIASVEVFPGTTVSALSPSKPKRFYADQPKQALTHAFERGSLAIRLPAVSRGSKVVVGIAYETTYDKTAPERPVNAEDPSYGVTATISDRGTLLLAEAHWYPEIKGSHPTFRLHVTGPEGLEAVTAGHRVERKTMDGMTSSVWEISQPLRGLSLSAGRYLVKEFDTDGIPIYAYFFPESQPLAETYLTAAADYIRFYSNLIGRYPFPKFAVVENFFPTGYGFPSYTLLGSSVIRLPFIVKISLGHEVAHSWFGNCLFVDYRYGNWSEGLTTYVADYLYKERSSAEAAKEYREQILRDYATLVPAKEDFPLADFVARNNPANRSVGYGKAAMVFHMVRRSIGDEAFWQGLRTIYREDRFQEVSWTDFAEAFGQCANMNLGAFFHQWVDRTGAPVLGLEGVSLHRTATGWKVTGKLTQRQPFYGLRVPIRLETDGAPRDLMVNVERSGAAFEIRSDAIPRKLVVDPDANVFRRLYPEEIPPSVNCVRGSSTLIAVTSDELPAGWSASAEMLLDSLGLDDTPILREGSVSDSDLRGHDVLFIGVPRNRMLLPPLPKGLSLGSDRFTLDSADYSDPTDALFVVFQRFAEKQRIAAIFLPLSQQAAQVAARKIPHYGKYGLLVFGQGANQMKKTWRVGESPLIFDFSDRKDVP